uniref:Uncharacterized protein n=1 Tax=Oryza nivara TaxID=4536 RepID=A0A679BA76_ORYNI|nr:hypothetical protein [Oryza sativa f. spontanea]
MIGRVHPSGCRGRVRPNVTDSLQPVSRILKMEGLCPTSVPSVNLEEFGLQSPVIFLNDKPAGQGNQ